MENRRHKRLAAMALAGAALVFFLHFLRVLTPLMLIASALAGTVALMALLMGIQRVRKLMRHTLHWVERRLPTDERG